MKNLFILAIIATNVVIFSSCKPNGNFTGREYMPDMGHSIAMEANQYGEYSNTSYTKLNDTSQSWYKLAQPRKPINGTIPRGFAGVMSKDGDARKEAWVNLKSGYIGANSTNGHVPYAYANTDEGRELAKAEINSNPVPLTAAGLATGKKLYEVNCAICHGEKGEANGKIVESGKYAAVPPSFVDDDLKSSSEGRYYHAIMHGKGVMGSYADKLSFEERWNVIHYIRSLQNPDYKNGAQVSLEDQFAETMKAVDQASEGEEIGIQLNNVFFQTGSADLKRASRYELNKLVKILYAYPNVKIRVDGHTDNVGNPADNQILSESRANSVMSYLLNSGISADRLSSKGFGQTKPVADNGTTEGKARNRRTEFVIIGK